MTIVAVSAVNARPLWPRLDRVAAYERQNKLDLALREIGRVERTLFMLDWLESPSLRRRVISPGQRRRRWRSIRAGSG